MNDYNKRIIAACAFVAGIVIVAFAMLDRSSAPKAKPMPGSEFPEHHLLKGHVAGRVALYHADGKTLMTHSPETGVRYWTTEHAETIQPKLAISDRIPPAALTSYGADLYVATRPGPMEFKCGDGEANTYECHDARILSDGKRIIARAIDTHTGDSQLAVCEIETGRVEATITHPQIAAFAPIHGSELVAVSIVLGDLNDFDESRMPYPGRIELYSLKTGVLQRTLIEETTVYGKLLCSSDGRLLVAAGADKWSGFRRMQFFDVESGQAYPGPYIGQHEEVTCLAFTPNEPIIAVGTSTGGIETWHLEPLEKLATMRTHDRMVYSMSFSPEGTRLATGGDDTHVAIWKVIDYSSSRE